MHTLDLNTSNVPAFLIKLWKLVEDPSCDDLIAWSDGGISFIIKDQVKFARELLPQYFKHNNMASFVRQLNMYGFRKVMNYERSGLRNDNNEMEFQHSFFVKEQCELLELIKRKIPNTRIVSESHVTSNPNDILTDLSLIREKQEGMDNMLHKVKQENELLWKELTNMRQKHKHQEQVIEKVIHFLVQVLRNQPVGVGIQRKMPRMLHDSLGSKGSTSQITTLDLLRKNPECIIVRDKDPHGPVIHEVTDFDSEDARSVSSVQSPTTVFINSPASSTSKRFTTSPAPNVVVLSPAAKSPSDCNEPVNPTSDCPLESSSLNTPINSASILDPLQLSTPAASNEAERNESILGVPLEYITAGDVAATLNSVDNVISLPEGCIVGNVISIPEGSDISDIISIPPGSDISSLLTIPDNQTSTNTSNVISDPCVTSGCSTDKATNSISLKDFYDTSVSLDDLQAATPISRQSSMDSSVTKHDFVDPLMSESLHTPSIHLTDEMDLLDFTVGGSKKRNTRTSEVSPQMSIAQREHDYPATVSDSSSFEKPSTLAKNTLSNHLLTVEEQLNRLQDHIATNTWDVDADKLLGLFSSDGIVNNDAFVNQLTDGIVIKKEHEDTLGNELVQFTPQLLESELDELRSPFLNALDSEVLTTDFLTSDLSDKKVSLLDDVIRDTLDDGTYLQEDDLSEGIHLSTSPNRRRTNFKIPKGKRRKLK